MRGVRGRCGARGPREGAACASLLLLALGCSEPAADAPAGAGRVTISVDATAPGAPLERVWAYHGYDELNYTTAPEGQALLKALVAAHTAPVHVRNHFLFNTGDGTPDLKWGSTNVYTQDAQGEPVYDWALTDDVLDTLTATGAAPFVELGFMPQALSTHPTPYRNSSELGLNGGCFYPPTDYAKWGDLVGAWATHASQRYPDDAAAWPWELWNEPDSAYWHGSFEEYAKLYDYTEAALHAVLPDAALGGPAVIAPDGPFLTQFLEHCESGSNALTGATGTRLDLVTFHAKGGVKLHDDHVELDLGNQLRLHRAGFSAVAAFPAFQATPIYISEADPDGCAACPTSFVEGSAYRTSTAYGAYEVAMMKRSLELAARLGVELRGVLTWAFTFPGEAYFAGYRELATHGINLPVLSAFQLLGQLEGARLPLSSSGARDLDDILQNGVRNAADVDGMATLSEGVVRVLVWNYHDELTDAPAAPVRLVLALPASFGARVSVSQLRVDEQHGDAYARWEEQGMPESPSEEQLAALQQAMVPAQPAPDRALEVGADRAVSLDFELPRFGVSLVTVAPAPESTGG